MSTSHVTSSSCHVTLHVRVRSSEGQERRVWGMGGVEAGGPLDAWMCSMRSGCRAGVVVVRVICLSGYIWWLGYAIGIDIG